MPWELVPDIALVCCDMMFLKIAIPLAPSHVFCSTDLGHAVGKPLAMTSLHIFLAVITLSFKLQPLPAGLEDFEAIHRMTHRPKNTYLNLQRL